MNTFLRLHNQTLVNQFISFFVHVCTHVVPIVNTLLLLHV
jgi:hypothetical protein